MSNQKIILKINQLKIRPQQKNRKKILRAPEQTQPCKKSKTISRKTTGTNSKPKSFTITLRVTVG